MASRSRLDELRGPGGRSDDSMIPLVENIHSNTQPEQYQYRQVPSPQQMPMYATTQGAANDERILSFPAEDIQTFYRQRDIIVSYLGQIRSNTTELHDLNRRTLNEVNPAAVEAYKRRMEGISNESMHLITICRAGVKTLHQSKRGDITTRENHYRSTLFNMQQTTRAYFDVQNEIKASNERQLARQYKIARPNATDEEIQQAINSGGNVFSQELLSSRVSEQRDMLNAVQERQRALEAVNQSMTQLAELTQELMELIQNQQPMLDMSEKYVQDVQVNIETSNMYLRSATDSAASARKKQWIILGIIVLVILIIAAIIAIFFILSPDWITHLGDKGRKTPIYSIHVQPIPEGRLATGGQDGKVKLWNVKPILDNAVEQTEEPRLLATLSSHSGAVLCVRWSNGNARFLASGSDDFKVVIWDQDKSGYRTSSFGESEAAVESWRPAKVLFGHESDVVDLAWSQENEYLASCGLDSHIFIWDGQSFEKLKKLDAHTEFVKGITWDPVGKYMATQSDDKTVKIWRVSDWAVEHEISEPYETASSPTFFRRLSWSPDGSAIVTANGENGNVPVAPVISRDDWSSNVCLVGHHGPIEVACFNPCIFKLEDPDDPNKKIISSICATAGQDKGISIWWTTKSFCLVSTEELFQHSIFDLAWSHDGMILYACSYDGSVVALSFDTAEIGDPLPVEDKITSLTKYGYSRKRQAVAENITQLRLEEFAHKNDSIDAMQISDELSSPARNTLMQSGQPEIARAALTDSSFSPISQKESRTKDGKKRIQPVFLRSMTGGEFAGSPDKQDRPMPNSSSYAHAQSIPFGVNMAGSTSTSSKRPRDEALVGVCEDKKVEYVLPACIVASKKPKLLAIPSVREKVLLQIPLLSSNAAANPVFFTLEYRPPEGSEKGSKLIATRQNEVQFTIRLSSEFGPANSRWLPVMLLPAPISHLDATGNFLMCITSTGSLFIWNLEEGKCIMSDTNVAPLVSNSETSDEEFSLLSAVIQSDGRPVLTISTNKVYSYDFDMKVWIDITGFERGPKAELGPPTINKSGFLVPNLQILGKMPSMLDHIESGLATSLALKSRDHYREWLHTYARRLADEGAFAKARELCEDLYDPLTSTAGISVSYCEKLSPSWAKIVICNASLQVAMSPLPSSSHAKELPGTTSPKRGLSNFGQNRVSGLSHTPSVSDKSKQHQSAKSKIRHLFDKYDLDSSGSISTNEFRQLCYDMGYFLTDKELALDVKLLDVDGDGEISYEEFITWWKQDDRFKSLQMNDEDYDKLSNYLHYFKKFDKDGSGIIDVREFKALYMDLVKRKMAKKTLMGTLQDIDTNKDGKVSFNEYVRWAMLNCKEDAALAASTAVSRNERCMS
ncbi:HIR complex subunit [Blyttiomyces sp. JEL0837]|nr:HIR complex subunit [Blyttiomyces sp. JEL0837]